MLEELDSLLARLYTSHIDTCQGGYMNIAYIHGEQCKGWVGRFKDCLYVSTTCRNVENVGAANDTY